MKKIIITVFLLLSSTSFVFAFGAKKQKAYEELGCCAAHKGVCGCQGQRAMCCDGAVATNCTCLKLKEEGEIVPSEEVNKKEG